MNNYILRCDLSGQYKRYKGQIDAALRNVLAGGVYTLGKEVELFEKEFAQYIGCAYGVAVASGTDALILALKAGGLDNGDEVITATYAPTPVATAIVLAGGKPSFVDVQEHTCLIDPQKIRAKLSKKTRFIICVHLFGSVCDMQEIKKISDENNIVLIEDAAQAHGSRFGAKKAGSFGDISCFSFYPTKNLGGYGDAGMVLTDSQRYEKLLRLLRNYGKKNNPYESKILGSNSRMDELQAAILRVKLKYLDRMNKRRINLAAIYKKGLIGTPLAFLEEYDNASSNYHILTVLCKERRDGLVEFLKSHSIQTNIYYPKLLHMMRPFKKYINRRDRFPVSIKIAKQALALPMYPELTEGKAMFIIEKIKQYF